MPIDVSMYNLPAQPAPPNLLGLAAQATTIQANQQLIAQRARELQKDKVLGEILQGAKGLDGKFDMGVATEALLTNPLTAAKAPEFARELLTQSGLKEDIAGKQMAAAIARQEMLSRAATGALEQRVQLSSGEWGLDMSHVNRGLAQIANNSPHMREQINATAANLARMTPSERYKAVEQAAYHGLSTKEGLDRLGGNLKLIQTQDGAVVGFNVKRPDQGARVMYKGPRKPVTAAAGSSIIDPETGEIIATAPEKPVALAAGATLVDPATGRVIAQSDAKDPAKEATAKALISDGMHPRIARGIAYGSLRLRTNPDNGQQEIFDIAAGKTFDYGELAREGTPEAARPANVVAGRFADAPVVTAGDTTPRAKPAIDLYGKASAGTGVVPSIEAAVTEVVPQLRENLPSGLVKKMESIPGVGGFFKAFPDTVEKRQDLDLAQNELVRSLAINAQFPVKEAERLRKEIGINPGLGSQEAMQARMRRVDTFLRARLASEQATVGDKAASTKQRQDARGHITAINRFLTKLNVPQSEERGTRGVELPPLPPNANAAARAAHEELSRRLRDGR